MDRLIKYIEFRKNIKGGIINYGNGDSSVYYTIGKTSVRISDHLKYSADEINKNDLHFIMLKDGGYLFHPSPKYSGKTKIYPDVMTYEQAKNYIKKLHDWELTNIGYLEHIPYVNELKHVEIPDDVVSGWEVEKMNFNDFKEKYMTNRPNNELMNIINQMEAFSYGGPRKGNLEKKLPTVETTYMDMNMTKYNTFIKKLAKEA